MINNFEYKGFTASVEFTPEEGLLVGKIADIDALIMFSADNVSDLAKEFKASVDGFISHCEEAGIEPAKPYKGTFNVRIGPEAHRRIAKVAKATGVSLNEAMRRASEEFIERHEKPCASPAQVVYVAVEPGALDVSRVIHLHQKLDVSVPYEGVPRRVGGRELRGSVTNPYGEGRH